MNKSNFIINKQNPADAPCMIRQAHRKNDKGEILKESLNNRPVLQVCKNKAQAQMWVDDMDSILERNFDIAAGNLTVYYHFGNNTVLSAVYKDGDLTVTTEADY